ncbi:hypothetical protein L873DRAFT_1692733 [Choiromyces venosus 120613-1]|uniref:Aminoglycoside phosphotransferase domain-containing protein n=1 Tax=Choiromyces venosus 120613-1 TaxID=1336337 RepID=A0A3N4JKC9_9PEZI|nr:hypothetical protein L873DRAFT_1692733 [Choiromyces venosus 120613-1]
MLYPGARLIYSRSHGACQIFDLGNGHLYKFRPHRDGAYESDIHALIQSATTIPIPTIFYEWVTVEDGDRGGGGRNVHVHHMVMEKIKGQPLHRVWGSLNPINKGTIVLQLTTYLDELRRITSPNISSFNGRAIQDEHGLLFERENTSGGPFPDNQSLWTAMTAHIRHSPSRTIQKAVINLRAIMPDGFPAVLTHADLHQGNIMIHEGNIAAIIDWEGAGFFPSWMEYVRYHPVSNAPELEFDNLVVQGMEAYPVAKRFMAILNALRGSDREMVEWAIRQLRR